MRSAAGRPSQKQAVRKAWWLVTSMIILMVWGAFDHWMWLGLTAPGFLAGVWSGRLLEARLAATGEGIRLDSSAPPLGRVEWPQR
jgi:hypothetical protein